MIMRRLDELEKENSRLQAALNGAERRNRGLRATVAPLLAARQFPGEEINETFKKLLEQLEVDRPSNRPLASAVVTVRLVTDSADQVINNHFIDRGGYVAFGKGPNALMVASSHDSFGNTMAANEVRYHAVFQMTADDNGPPQ